ncbi:MAG: hypothetical protein AAGI90_00690 [Chlamydiota bacterium]
MKQMYFLLLLSVLAISLSGAPAGSPLSPALLQKGLFSKKHAPCALSSGYAGNFVFDRRLNQYKTGEGRVDNYELYSQSGLLTVTLMERASFCSLLGSGKIESDFCVVSDGVLRHVVTKTEEDFSLGFGSDLLLLDWRLFALGAGLLYTKMRPALTTLTVDGISYKPGGARFSYEEWQGHVGISYQVGFLMPYIGTKYTSASSEVTLPCVRYLFNESNRSRFFRSRKHWGLYLGCSVTRSEVFALTIETRLIDEEAVSVFAEIRF